MNSHDISDIAEALASAQAEMQNAIADAHNPDFERSDYATLAAVRNATIPVLAKHKIATVQTIGRDKDNMLALLTKLIHKSGQWIESSYPLPESLLPHEPHAFGSALSYARRYSLGAICGIATEKDDDANIAALHLLVTEKHPGLEPVASRFDEGKPVEKKPLPIPPAPPLPPEPEDVPFDTIARNLFAEISAKTDLDSLVNFMSEEGFTSKDAPPMGGRLRYVYWQSRPAYDEVVAAYLARLKELTKPKTKAKA